MTVKDKKERILVCVESPNKVKTIKQFLPDNYIIMASVGHITRLADSGEYNMGIDIKNNFKGNYEIPKEKKEVVSKLKEQVRLADKIILMSDEDREGECIAWHLKEELKIPDNKYERCTTHEITESAIKKAIANPRKIDYDLVASGTAREKADKIIGYRLSGIARNNVGARSVGRCQSAGLKLIVEREEEIQNFKPKTYYDFYLHFSKNKTDFTAKYIGTDIKEIKNLESLEECKKISEECKNKNYSILSVNHKDVLENPKAPFITATYQQEVSKKLNISVKSAMEYAQKLFEGIEVNGRHVALITYHRTDCADLAPEFLEKAKEYVIDSFGKEYYQDFKVSKKKDTDQEAHEAIRCVDIEFSPKRLAKYISDERLLKIYDIIWRRSIACCMSPAIIANTIYTIENGKHRFGMTSKELKFEGYRKIYNFGKDEDDSEDVEGLIKETFNEKEILQNTSLEAVEKQTQPPKRYNEASFIKELGKQEIGRPSTYATILGVILDDKRGYTKIEDKYIVPTQLGINLSHFLDEKFSDVINIKYTAELEKELDLIAKGKKDGIEFLTNFYNNLENNINKLGPQTNQTINEKCPQCGGNLVIRRGKYSLFKGCTNYPSCKYSQKLK